ncbi:MAG: hypothetical protein V1688_01085 [bacterium]
MELIDQILLWGNYIIPAIILTGITLMFYALLFKTETFLPFVKFAKTNRILTFNYFPFQALFFLIYRKKPTTNDDWLQMLRIGTIVLLTAFIVVFLWALLF